MYYKLAPTRSKVHEMLIDSLSYCCRDMPELLKDDEQLG